MTNAPGRPAHEAVARVYGANELGVLALTAPGDDHPRVQYVAGEVFVGLDVAGAPITRAQAEQLPRPFDEVLAEALAPASTIPDAVGGVILIEDEAAAAGVLTAPARGEVRGLAGETVAFVLARDRLALVGAEDETAIGRVLDLAEELYDQERPLVSAHPLVLTDRGWAPFAWPERLPALQTRMQRVLRLFGVRAYEAQSVVLQRPDVHVADPKIHVREDGVTLTFAAWPKGTATLLPVVDNVMIADPSGAISVATMEQFLDAAGDAVVRTGLSPLRYFVPGEPPRR